MISTITSKGQITIPVEIRRAIGLATGTQVEFIVNHYTRIELVPLQTPLRSLRGSIPPRSTQGVQAATTPTARATKTTRPNGAPTTDDPPQSRYPVTLTAPTRDPSR